MVNAEVYNDSLCLSYFVHAGRVSKSKFISTGLNKPNQSFDPLLVVRKALKASSC